MNKLWARSRPQKKFVFKAREPPAGVMLAKNHSERKLTRHPGVYVVTYGHGGNTIVRSAERICFASGDRGLRGETLRCLERKVFDVDRLF
jgi:hypothetical protein